jgi:aryl-alcohol dehydrogenase-like predicted oxidoreductase
MSDLPAVLGTMHFGTKTDEKTSFALLDRFVEAGGTVIDTANCYAFWLSDTGAGGQSEQVVGRWLAANPGLRERLTIATKVGVEPAQAGVFPGLVEGLSAKTIAEQAPRSLERLGIEKIDLYWAHADDRTVPLEETLGAFAELVDAGQVGRIGASNHATWRIEQARFTCVANGWPEYSALQLSTSYIRPRPDVPAPNSNSHRFGFVSTETTDYLEAHPELELWAYSPLVGGSYGRADRPVPDAYDHPGTTRRLEVLGQIAAELGVSPARVVLAWLTSSTPRIIPIIGASSVEQLDDGLAGARLELDAMQLIRLNDAY